MAHKLPQVQLSIRQVYRTADLTFKRHQLKKVIALTLAEVGITERCALGIACVDLADSQTLNRDYRHKDKPTNVLSFEADVPPDVVALLDERPLGDLVICIPVVLKEAAQQHKSAEHHFYHLVVHGVLHLLGYDHELGDAEAAEMEALEIAVLAQVGIANPYDI